MLKLSTYLPALEDAEEAVATAVPEADVAAPGDTVAAETPVEAINPETQVDAVPEPMLSTNEDVAEAAATAAEAEHANDIKTLTAEAEQVQAAQTEIVEEAQNIAAGEQPAEVEDVNGNAVAEEPVVAEEPKATADVEPLEAPAVEEPETTDEVVEAETTEEPEAQETAEPEVADQPEVEAETTEETVEAEAEAVEEAVEEAKDEASETEEAVEAETTEPVVEEAEAEELAEDEIMVPDVDTDTTEADVVEAENKATEVEEEAAADEAEIDEAEKTIEELQKETAAVESFIGVLDHGLRHKSYSAQTLALAQTKLNELQQAFGAHSPVVPAMENYNNDNLDAYYTASLESFRGFLSRLASVNRRIDEKIVEWWHKSGIVKRISSRADSVNKAIDVTLSAMQAAEIPAKSDVKGIPSDLTTSATSLAAAVAADLRITTEIATKGLAANEKLQSSIVDIVNEAIKDGGVGKSETILNKALQLPLAVEAYPKDAFQAGGLVGNKILARGDAKATKDFAAKIEQLRVAGIPTVVKSKIIATREFSLTKAELVNLMKMAKVYVGLANKLAQVNGVKAVENKIDHRYTRNRALDIMGSNKSGSTRATTWSEGKQMDALVTELPKLAEAHIDIYKFAADHCLDVADALVTVVKRVLK